jgi:hypothetical protein
MVAVAKKAKKKDFDVTMKLSKNNMETVLDTYVFAGSQVLADVDSSDNE